jgi:hypothetical protein
VTSAANVTAVALNITVTQGTGLGDLLAYPSDPPRPDFANLNWTPGETVATFATVTVINGRATFTNTSAGTVHIVADLFGYYSG